MSAFCQCLFDIVTNNTRTRIWTR